MENKPTNIEDLFQKLKEYGETRLELFKLKGINKISSFSSIVLTMVMLTLVLIAVFFCVTVGLALVIGECVGKAYYGFFIVGGSYLIIGLVLYAMRDKLIRTPVANKLIKELFD